MGLGMACAGEESERMDTSNGDEQQKKRCDDGSKVSASEDNEGNPTVLLGHE